MYNNKLGESIISDPFFFDGSHISLKLNSYKFKCLFFQDQIDILTSPVSRFLNGGFFPF